MEIINAMTNYFITGTDTSVGKTTSCAALVFALKCHYWKPIQSGVSDIDVVKQLTALPADNFISPTYSFNASLSPDQAAHLENKTIDLQHITASIPTQRLIIEGAGGIFVPLNRDHCMLHLMQKLNFPIVIVSRGTLGTINHTLMTIDVLRRWGLTIHGVIFCGELNPDNQLAIETWGKVRTLLHLPFFSQLNPANFQQWVNEHQSTILENFS